MTTALAERKAPELPEPVARRGITEAQWRTLMNSLFPGAKGESVLLVWDYCQARRLDPLKKPCHIVPMEIKVGDHYEWRDVVMPGIYELRTTAQRTGEYLGHAKPEYGPSIDWMGISAPEWCDITVYRWNDLAKMRAEFPVRVLFREAVGITKDRKSGEWKANSRWSKAPVQMLTKCTEAAGLREAFPDELGGQHTAEEMDGQRAVDVSATTIDAEPVLVKPDGYDDWMDDMSAVSDEGDEKLSDAWKASLPAMREYAQKTDPSLLESWKTRAAAADAAQSAQQ